MSEPSSPVQKYFDSKSNTQVIDEVCNHVRKGGSVTSYARIMKVETGHVLALFEGVFKRLLREAREERKEYIAERTIEELDSLATFNIADMFNDHGAPKQPHELPLALQRAIKGFKRIETTDKDGNTIVRSEIQFIDKLKALEMIGKEAGMFANKINHEGKLTLEGLVAKSYENKE